MKRTKPEQPLAAELTESDRLEQLTDARQAIVASTEADEQEDEGATDDYGAMLGGALALIKSLSPLAILTNRDEVPVEADEAGTTTIVPPGSHWRISEVLGDGYVRVTVIDSKLSAQIDCGSAFLLFNIEPSCNEAEAH